MEKQEQNKNSYLVKLLVASVLQLVFLIPWIVFVVLVTKDFNQYGWGVDFNPGTINNLSAGALPVAVQLKRIWLLILSSTTALLWARCAYLCFKTDKTYLSTLGIFTWVLVPYLIIKCLRERAYSAYWTWANFNYCNQAAISFKELKYDLRRGSLTKISKNTIFYLFALWIFIIGFIFIMMPMQQGAKYLDEFWTFNALCYFTHQTNILCFLFLCAYPFINKKSICRDNTVQINLTTYITVVGLIYWVALFPGKVSSGAFQEYSLQHQIESVWLHGVTPVIFIIFLATCVSNNLMYPNKAFGKEIGKMLIYPLWYGSTAYALPFMVHESIYGKWTNLNPDAWTFASADGFIQEGSAWYTFTIPALGLLFIFFMWVYRCVSSGIVNNQYRYMRVMENQI